MNTYELSEIIKRIIDGFPIVEGQPCKNLQTFAFVWDEEQINAENLGKTVQYKDEPFFYSRLWKGGGYNANALKFQYPALLIWEDGDVISKPFDQQNKASTTYVFKFVDKMPNFQRGKQKATPCQSRIYEQVVQDLKSNVYGLFKKMGEFAFYELFLGGVKTGEGWYIESDIDSFLTNGDIDHYIELEGFSSIASNEVSGSVVPNAHIADTVSIFYRITIQNTHICRTAVELQPIASPKPTDPSRGCCP